MSQKFFLYYFFDERPCNFFKGIPPPRPTPVEVEEV